MLLDFLVSILISFGIASLIGIILKIISSIMKKGTEEETKRLEIIKTNDDEFDKTIIELTKSKISNELTIFNSIKMNVNALVGIAGIVFSIMLTLGFQKTTAILAMRANQIQDGLPQFFYLFGLVANIVGLALLIVPLVFAFMGIFPMYKTANTKPRFINNEYSNKKDNKLIYNIKKNLIIELETLEEENYAANNNLKKGYVLFGMGLILLFFVFTLDQGTALDQWINDVYFQKMTK